MLIQSDAECVCGDVVCCCCCSLLFLELVLLVKCFYQCNNDLADNELVTCDK